MKCVYFRHSWLQYKSRNLEQGKSKTKIFTNLIYYVHYAEGKSKFSEHVLNEGHEMKTKEETMSIIHLENNHRKINTLEDYYENMTLEEIKILKAASSKYLLNDVIAGQNDPIYKLLPISVI